MPYRTVALAISAMALSAAALAASGDAQLVAKVDPEFPREAVQAGVDHGVVKARMTVDGTGEVTRVEVLEARPRGGQDAVAVAFQCRRRRPHGGNRRQLQPLARWRVPILQRRSR